MSREAFTQVLASLAAAISLLERGGKKAAASDRMFEQMLDDYRAALEAGRNALSQQAEPAQDERQAFEAWMVEVEGARIRPRFDRVTAGPFADEYRDGRIQGAWNVWQARASRPAQTEQPVMFANAKELAERNESPCCDWSATDYCTVPLYAAPIAQTEQEPVAWMLEGAVGGSCLEFQQSDLFDSQRRYGGCMVPLYATPIAQTAPQPEQSGLVEALKAMLETYGPPAAVADKCTYPVDHPITKARAALSAGGRDE